MAFNGVGAHGGPLVLWKGDLNEILWDYEKSDGKDEFYTHPRLLHEFMLKIKLIDLGFNRPQYIWRRTRNNSLV